MIIRPLRPDERRKQSAVASIAYSFSADLDENADEKLTSEIIGAFLDDGETIAAVTHPITYSSNYCGEFLPSVGIAGVASLPEYRRSGCVRAIFNEILRMAPERGWATSYLYPFSYAYYRQFGYERVLQKKIVKMPTDALSTFERNPNAVLYTGGAAIEGILAIYKKFAARHNMMFARDEKSRAYSAEPHKSKRWTYVWSDGGVPSSYATVTVGDDTLNVSELVFNDAAGLAGIIGFLRMFEGQVSEVCFRDLPAESELDYMLKKYIDCEYSLHNAAMGRVVLVEDMLRRNAYPEAPGRFVLRVDDFLDYNRGVYEVEYSGGKADVKKLAGASAFDTACYDVSMEIPALTRVMLGCDDFDADKASYLAGVKLNNAAAGFFRAFPKRRCYLYDHF